MYSTTVIAKIKRNAAVIILRYTTLRHNGLWECEEIRAFEVQNHVNYM